MSTETQTCQIRKNVCIDAWVRAEFPLMRDEREVRSEDGRVRAKTAAEIAQLLVERCEEFEVFLRDHRSQDVVSMGVRRTYADLCSACGKVWDPDEDDTTGEICCGNCGAVLAAPDGA